MRRGNVKKRVSTRHTAFAFRFSQRNIGEAKKAVRHFLSDPLGTQIDAHIRRLIRENQSVVPEAGTTSRELALECLTTQQFNVFCPYHHTIDKGGKIVDGKAGQKYVLNGVPLPRETVSPKDIKRLKKKKSSLFRPNGQFRNARIRKGYLNCGCSVDAGLWDLYLWKTLTITGLVDGKEVAESMGDQRLTPRVRAFMIKAIEDMACLTIDDLYTGNRNLSPYQHQEKMLSTQLGRIIEKYNDVATRLGIPKLKLVDDGEMRVPGPPEEFSGFS